MGESAKLSNLDEILKPFHQRASEAEARLQRLEASLNARKDAGNEEHLKTINDLQSKLEVSNAELISEKEKVILVLAYAQKLAAENEKLQYRIIHLLRALKDNDQKLEQKR
ncbi:hypothetical protein AAHE18_12G111100 [Arachis hypogaea]